MTKDELVRILEYVREQAFGVELEREAPEIPKGTDDYSSTRAAKSATRSAARQQTDQCEPRVRGMLPSTRGDSILPTDRPDRPELLCLV